MSNSKWLLYRNGILVIKFALHKYSYLYCHVELLCKLSNKSVNKRDSLKIINLYLKSNRLVDYPRLFRGFHNIHSWWEYHKLLALPEKPPSQPLGSLCFCQDDILGPVCDMLFWSHLHLHHFQFQEPGKFGFQWYIHIFLIFLIRLWTF